MFIKIDGFNAGGGSPVTLRCPQCRQLGTFELLHGIADVITGEHLLGSRRCPNPKCRTHVFVVLSHGGARLLASYPPERIDFDTTGVPSKVTEALEEAITCHATGCFKASAIMVRRTLEELCRDQNAAGANLKARVAALESKIVLPKVLLDAIDELRLLGNDAAHLEAKVYDDVGQAEVEAGVAVAKEVLKAVYQYSTLVKQLQALKKAP